MNPEDDPEARIRELERSLSDQAKASELGGSQSTSGTAYQPPPAQQPYSSPGYSAQPYESQPYQSQPYGSQPFGAQPSYGTQPYQSQPLGNQPYGAQPYGNQFPVFRRRSSGGIPWVTFGLLTVGLPAISAAILFFHSKTPGGGTIDMPSIPASPAAPSADSEVITASPNTPANYSGMDESKTINCTDGDVNVSGIRNTVNITGHCVSVTVVGINNKVTIDAADKIGAYGTDNQVTYRTGTPQVDTSGSNTVSQGG